MTPEPAQPAESPEARALPQPSAAATAIALTAKPGDFPTDSYSLAMWLDRAILAAATARPTERGAVEAEVQRLMHVIDRDRYVVAHCVAAIKQAVAGRTWLLTGRGPYEWDDDDYRKEFGDALLSIEQAAEPLAVVAWDKSDCTRIEERVNAAKLAARDMLAKKHGPRDMVPADIFRDPRDLEIARLTGLIAALTPPVTVAATDQAGEVEKARDTAQSLVEAWASVFEGLEAHLQDRVAMRDEANPASYLSILRSSVANVLQYSQQVRAARWADYNRQSARIAELEAALATQPATGRTMGGEVIEQLRMIVEVVANADSEDCIGSLDVDIPRSGYPRQWLREAARAALQNGGERP